MTPAMNPSAALAQGRDAFQERAWNAAYEALAVADRARPLDTDDLWRLAMSAHLTGREDAFLNALERAHHAHLAADAPVRAARCAFWLGFRLANRGETGPATGWFRRAARLLEGTDHDCAERGYLLLPTAYRHLGTGEYEAAYTLAADAAAIAERFREPDLRALAVLIQGIALLRQARVDDGLALLDEAMVAVATDELSPHVTGLIYCSVISACRAIYALRRAQEWTAALAEWCERQPDMVAYSGPCRVNRAEVMRLRGEWREALGEAQRACDGFSQAFQPQAVGAAFYQRGEAHRLLGEFAAAEEAYRQARRWGSEPQPGLALLRLAQGQKDAAAAAIRRVVGETADPLHRARLLPAHIEIMLAVDDVDAAREACRDLEQIAERYGSDVLRTMVAHARGAIDLAAGDAMAALVALRQAWQGWTDLEAPYEAARVRVLVATACRALGDEDTASLELEAARDAFEALGAAPDRARVDAMIRGESGDHPHGLTPRERQVLALVATGKTNRAIAAELFISEKTVARHVSNILGKLRLPSRSAATAWAYEHGLASPST
ncbi:MAG TPA: LuxR C-terminal-related transcriptional regulator [Longimicrobiales bacterium]